MKIKLIVTIYFKSNVKCHFNIIECPLKFILTPGEKIVNFPLCEVVKKNQNDKGRTLS